MPHAPGDSEGEEVLRDATHMESQSQTQLSDTEQQVHVRDKFAKYVIITEKIFFF